jgi:hypothetical protein
MKYAFDSKASPANGNAAKHFRSRIRENSGIQGRLQSLTTSATIVFPAFSVARDASQRCVNGVHSDRTRAAILFACISLLGASGALAETSPAAKTPVDYVNPKIGTAQEWTRWMLFPGATEPFGMVSVSPHNLERTTWYKGGFDPRVNSIAGFSHLRGPVSNTLEYG